MGFIQRLKDKVKVLKQDTLALYYAYQHPHVPLKAKILIGITIGYLLSPIDLIPDFIPVIGLLDDLVIVPLLIIWSVKLIPAIIWAESKEKAKNNPIILKGNKWMVIIIVVIWLLVIYAVWHLIWRKELYHRR